MRSEEDRVLFLACVKNCVKCMSVSYRKDLSTPIPGDFFSGGALGWGREGVVHLMLFPLGQAGTYMMQLLS